jgi:hypothetical protein
MMGKQRRLLILVILLVVNLEPGFRGQLFSDTERTESSKYKRKNHIKAGIQTSGINMTIWMYNRYVIGEDWAKVNLESIINNFKHGFVWDKNSFNTNIFWHPYHGSLYFSSARAAGLNFWESSLYPMAGSLMWEFFLETDLPSANDVMTTGFGGVMLGEILFRFFHQVLNKSPSDKRNILREAVGYLINPMGGVNRLLSGKHTPTNSIPTSEDFDFHLIIGRINTKSIDADFPLTSRKTMISLELRSNEELKTGSLSPYDYYRFALRLQFTDRLLPQGKLISEGILLGKETELENQGFRIVGLFAGYDAMNTLESGSQSLLGAGFGWVVSPRKIPHLEMNLSVFITAGLGASTASHGVVYGEDIYRLYGETYHFSFGEDAYYMGPGASVKLYGDVAFANKLKLDGKMIQYWTSSFHARRAYELLNVLHLGIRIKLLRHLDMCFEYSGFKRLSHYRTFPILRRHYQQLYIGLGMHLD